MNEDASVGDGNLAAQEPEPEAEILRLRAELEAAQQQVQAQAEEIQRLEQQAAPDLEAVSKEVRRRFARFITDRVNPGHLERQRRDLSSWSPELFVEAGQLGLLGFNVGPEIGGEGRDAVAFGVLLEELGKLIEDP